MRKVTAIFLSFLMVFSGMIIFAPIVEEVQAAESTVDFDCTISARIYKQGSTYGTWTSTNINIPTNMFYCEKDYVTPLLTRGYIGFDTSSLPDGAIVTSASLRVYQPVAAGVPFTLSCYIGDAGSSYTVADWGCGTGSGAFVDSIYISTTGATQYVLDVTSSLINDNGYTTFEFVMPNEGTASDQYVGIYGHAAHYLKVPNLEVTYTMEATGVVVETGGSVANLTLISSAWSYNNTHDMAMYEFDSHTGMANISIPIPQSWTLYGFNPIGTYTDDGNYLNITGVFEGVTYRIYFTYEASSIVDVHVSIYQASTGEGFPFETWRIKYCENLTYNDEESISLSSADFKVDYGGNYSIGVLDYYGNVITTQAFVANSFQKFIDIPLDIHSFKVYNQQEDFTRFRIYYNGTGAALTFFCAPNEAVERYLRPGDYAVVVTQYPGGVAATSEWFNITVDDAEFLKVNGTSISMVISDVAGVQAMQAVITSLVTPDMVFVVENMPSVSTEAIEYIHPWSVVTANAEDVGSGTSIAMWLPHPNVAGTTYTILSDRLLLSGQYNTEIWVNTTAGANVYHASVLPASVTLGGQNLTVQTNSSISVMRQTEWRAETLFYWSYYTTQHRYEVTLDVNNSMSKNMTDVNWFIGFAENRSVDLESVAVYDIDNAVYLVEGLNYDIGTSGVRMYFDTLAAGLERNFRISCYDANASTGQSVPLIIISSKVDAVWGGDDYYKCSGSWTSSYATVYNGQLNIKLDFTGSEAIKTESVFVVDASNNNMLSADQWYISGNVVTINYVTADPGDVLKYDVYFLLDASMYEGFDPFAPLITVFNIPISAFNIGVIVVIGTGALAISEAAFNGLHTRAFGWKAGLFITVFSIVCFFSALSYTGAM